ncbi:MAG: hypothetical protein U0V70_04540 [Terriglobia bacterium]
MKRFILTALMMTMLLASTSVFATEISIGVTIGSPPPPPPPNVVYAHPPCPGPEFVWIPGYWYPVGKHHKYKWHEGYWTRPPYMRAAWVPPRYDGGRYYMGYWRGNHGEVEHNHHWDKDHDRDYHSHGNHQD